MAAFVAVGSVLLVDGRLDRSAVSGPPFSEPASPKPASDVSGGVPIGRAPDPQPSRADAAAGATMPGIARPTSPPTRLIIPSLGVNAEVEPVGDDAQGHMAAPSRAERVGWYQPGAMPGDAGNAVLDGHLDWTTGPAVFWHLARLGPGDEVSVQRADGSQVKFVVDSKAVFPFNASPPGLFTNVGPPALVLVTCYGPWDRQNGTYADRLVVHAALAPPPSAATPGDEGG